jgi:tetratricopeptide (TPR) repeat protein
MDKLAAARAAFAAHDWIGAREGFVAARERTTLDADDLHALAEASWWLGLMDESQAARKEAYGAYLKASDNRRAAMRAVDIAYAYFLRGDGPVGSGWVNRAQRLVEDEPDCPEQGYLLYLAVETSLDSGEETLTNAREVQGFGRRHGDHNLIAAGMVAEGRVLIKLGRAPEGVALLDEGMLEASSEDLLPNWAGNIYCHLMAACYELGDIRRATAWTQSTSEWCDRMAPAVLFKGICRVHRAQVMQIRGAWTQAQDEAERICEEVAHIHVGIVAEAHYQIGEIRRLSGDLEGAEDAYHQGHGGGRDPQPGLALLRLAQGRTEAAAALIHSALAGVTDRLSRARLLAAQVEIAIADDDPATASVAADELDAVASAYGSSGLQAAAKRSRGSVLLATGRTEEALSTLRLACTGWTELEAPYDCAKVRVLLARAYRQLGDIESSERELDAACSAFEELGAELDAKEVDGERRATLPSNGASLSRRSRPKLTGTFRREGDVWQLTYDGTSVRLRDAKGLADLAVMLARPGREVHVAELVGAVDLGPRPAGDALLDDKAIASYRARLTELAEEEDEADTTGDAERSAVARAEREALVDRLSSDLGLGGRSRTAEDWAERARKAVRTRVASALKRIDVEHPSLGRHLRASVKTGAYCAYDPPEPVTWQL